MSAGNFRRWLFAGLQISLPVAALVLSAGGAIVCAAQGAKPAELAGTPPMGWNSWDSYGRTLNEDTIKANAQWMAKHLKPFGWEYVVIDEGWYLANIGRDSSNTNFSFQLDEYGRYVPVPARFPSAGKDSTFKPLADYLHSLGLKFGIHMIRGIPREAVARDLPIAGTRFHASDAADKSDVCPWNNYNYGLDPTKPAAQAYYDSLTRQYAEWSVDFVKIDCISDHPYKAEEIRMFSEAVAKSGRSMVISLSPGPTSFAKREEVAKYAQMWRISDDVWDVWNSKEQFPEGVKNQFEQAARWAGFGKSGHWPDADMLPLGSLRPSAGWGPPRDSRLTHDEQRTLFTLWSIFRSPMIMGGNLLQADEWTTSLLTNAEVLAVGQHSIENRPILTTDNLIVWTARPDGTAASKGDFYVAVFNVSDATQKIHYSWKELGIDGGTHEWRDLWTHKELPPSAELVLTLPPHAPALLRVSPEPR